MECSKGACAEPQSWGRRACRVYLMSKVGRTNNLGHLCSVVSWSYHSFLPIADTPIVLTSEVRPNYTLQLRRHSLNSGGKVGRGSNVHTSQRWSCSAWRRWLCTLCCAVFSDAKYDLQIREKTMSPSRPMKLVLPMSAWFLQRVGELLESKCSLRTWSPSQSHDWRNQGGLLETWAREIMYPTQCRTCLLAAMCHGSCSDLDAIPFLHRSSSDYPAFYLAVETSLTPQYHFDR